jgi:hypothetical protein
VEEALLAKCSCPQLFPRFLGFLYRALRLGQLLGRTRLVNHESLLRLLRQKCLSPQTLPQLQISSFSCTQIVSLPNTETTTEVALLTESAHRAHYALVPISLLIRLVWRIC